MNLSSLSQIYQPLVKEFKTLDKLKSAAVVANLKASGYPIHSLTDDSEKNQSPSFKSFLKKVRDAVLEYLAHNYPASGNAQELEPIIHKVLSDKTKSEVINEASDLVRRMHDGTINLQMPIRS